jgi:hypothetical protein
MTGDLAGALDGDSAGDLEGDVPEMGRLEYPKWAAITAVEVALM